MTDVYPAALAGLGSSAPPASQKSLEPQKLLEPAAALPALEPLDVEPIESSAPLEPLEPLQPLEPLEPFDPPRPEGARKRHRPLKL